MARNTHDMRQQERWRERQKSQQRERREKGKPARKRVAMGVDFGTSDEPSVVFATYQQSSQVLFQGVTPEQLAAFTRSMQDMMDAVASIGQMLANSMTAGLGQSLQGLNEAAAKEKKGAAYKALERLRELVDGGEDPVMALWEACSGRDGAIVEGVLAVVKGTLATACSDTWQRFALRHTTEECLEVIERAKESAPVIHSPFNPWLIGGGGRVSLDTIKADDARAERMGVERKKREREYERQKYISEALQDEARQVPGAVGVKVQISSDGRTWQDISGSVSHFSQPKED